jgi:hypothetical protein
VVVPQALLVAGGDYTITLKLGSFLGGVSATSVSFSVAPSPVQLRISGPSTVATFSSTGLSLRALVDLSDCTGQKLNVSIALNWRIFSGTQLLLALTSSASNPRLLTLPPYSLNSSTVYTAVVSASLKGDPSGSTTFAQVRP